MMNRLCLIGVLVMVGAGCGGAIDYVVDPDYLKEVSREGQRWIYDAENEIVVALDKLDEAKDIRLKTRRRIRAAEKAVERAEKRNKRLGVEVAEAWLSYLELLEEWTEDNIDLMRLGVVVARATVEQAKAQVINREDLLGGKGFAMGDYKEQYNTLKDEFDKERRRVKKLRKRARKRNKKWWTLRRRFVAQTGDYDSGLWID